MMSDRKNDDVRFKEMDLRPQHVQGSQGGKGTSENDRKAQEAITEMKKKQENK
ncbi:hypothetical protein [Bremerella sp. P1]|uniref:hypothetical protein n=1 Tax=Bremerella sp. P1 TaxID=3026424 RepID=UPI0023685C87|nr:hypothetical protein [Bremerella sp. P1]WDI40223.1 hypothetical protein PSR63_17220 [Bremerella sp. P1]